MRATPAAAAAAAVAVLAAGCIGAADSGDPAPDSAASSAPSAPAPPRADASVDLTWRPPSTSGTLPWGRTAAEAELSLGEPSQQGTGHCSLAPGKGKAAVPVTLTLTHPGDDAADTDDDDVLAVDDWPVDAAADAVGGAGPLMWSEDRSGECSEELDLDALTAEWAPRQQRTALGEVIVPTDPAGSGAGVQVDFGGSDPERTEVRGAVPEPLTATY